MAPSYDGPHRNERTRWPWSARREEARLVHVNSQTARVARQKADAQACTRREKDRIQENAREILAILLDN